VILWWKAVSSITNMVRNIFQLSTFI